MKAKRKLTLSQRLTMISTLLEEVEWQAPPCKSLACAISNEKKLRQIYALAKAPKRK